MLGEKYIVSHGSKEDVSFPLYFLVQGEYEVLFGIEDYSN
jgi:hypothetical protein